MKAKEEYLLEDGLIGDPKGVDQNCEGYKKLKQTITENIIRIPRLRNWMLNWTGLDLPC